MLNQINIMGRMVRDPEIRYTNSQVPVASFTLAVDRDFGKDDKGNKTTDFIDCSAWRQTAEFIGKYFQKGSMAIVTGSLQAQHWTDKDGNKRTSWYINVGSIYFGESKKDSGATQGLAPVAPPAQQQESYQQTGFHEITDEDGELPF